MWAGSYLQDGQGRRFNRQGANSWTQTDFGRTLANKPTSTENVATAQTDPVSTEGQETPWTPSDWKGDLGGMGRDAFDKGPPGMGGWGGSDNLSYQSPEGRGSSSGWGAVPGAVLGTLMGPVGMFGWGANQAVNNLDHPGLKALGQAGLGWGSGDWIGALDATKQYAKPTFDWLFRDGDNPFLRQEIQLDPNMGMGVLDDMDFGEGPVTQSVTDHNNPWDTSYTGLGDEDQGLADLKRHSDQAKKIREQRESIKAMKQAQKFRADRADADIRFGSTDNWGAGGGPRNDIGGSMLNQIMANYQLGKPLEGAEQVVGWDPRAGYIGGMATGGGSDVMADMFNFGGLLY